MNQAREHGDIDEFLRLRADHLAELTAPLEGRLDRLMERLDARRAREAPGQMGLDLEAGTGQPCGQSHIAAGLTCHKGATAAAAKPLRKAQVELAMAGASDEQRVRRFKLTLSGGDGPPLEVSAKVHAIPTNVRMRDPDTDWVWSTQLHRRVAELGNEVGVSPIVKTLPIGSGIPGKAPTIQALDLSFEVGLQSTALQSGLDRKSMSPDDGALVARNVFRQMSEMLRDLPDGTTLTCNCWNQDGYGQRRKRLYETLGFRFPEGATNDGIALVKAGKIAKAGRTDSAVDPDEEAFVKAALELPEIGAVSPSELTAPLEGRLDRLEQRLDIFESDISAQAMAPGGLHGGITDRRTPKQKESDQRRAAALEKKFGRKSGLLQQATQGAGGGQPCGASHISPAFECHKGQGPASSADEQIEAITEQTLKVLQKFPEYMPSAEQRHGITDTELAVLQHYAENGYSDMNGFLRGEKPADPELARKLNGHMKAALAKLPEFEGPVSRGVAIPKAVLEQQFQVGQVGWDPGYGSTTKQLEEEAGGLGQEWSPNFFAAENARGRAGMGRVLLRYAPGHGGKDITHLSGNPAEQEVLIPPGQKFRVTARQEEQRLVWGTVGRRPETFTVIDLEPVRRPRRDGLGDRLAALHERLETQLLHCHQR